jgi:hypothetical protein
VAQSLRTIRCGRGRYDTAGNYHTGREFTREENAQLREYAESIIIKGVRSEERLLDEAPLFLHRVVSKMRDKKGIYALDNARKFTANYQAAVDKILPIEASGNFKKAFSDTVDQER